MRRRTLGWRSPQGRPRAASLAGALWSGNPEPRSPVRATAHGSARLVCKGGGGRHRRREKAVELLRRPRGPSHVAFNFLFSVLGGIAHGAAGG
jgi:hypothetical protein